MPLFSTNHILSVSLVRNVTVFERIQRSMMIGVTLFLCLCAPVDVMAWDANGHRLIAEIAYLNVRADVRKALYQSTQVMNKHYRQERFSMSASWMDEIKVFHHVGAFNHWHYINLPYGNTQAVVPDKENIVWALHETKTVLKNPQSNAFEKSFFLRFFIHLSGDIHQPLHCFSVYSPQFPHGDAGGTLYKLDDPHFDNLHRFWDAAGGVFAVSDERHALRNKALTKTARALMARYPQSEFKKELEVSDFEQWSRESYALAQDSTHTIPYGGKITPQYRSNTQNIAQKQIVLAGYRLAQQLNEIYLSH